MHGNLRRALGPNSQVRVFGGETKDWLLLVRGGYRGGGNLRRRNLSHLALRHLLAVMPCDSFHLVLEPEL